MQPVPHFLAGRLLVIWGLLSTALPLVSGAAIYHVSLSGIDTNPGTSELPWRTVQKASTAMQPGDTAVVHAGDYAERITTVRGGTSDDSRIVFTAEGTVITRGFSIRHPYVSVDGFEITGHSAPSKLTGFIEVQANGDYARVLNNTIRDGVALVRPDYVFSHNTPAPNTISSATGGFLSAGFRPGMTLGFSQTERNIAVANTSSNVLIESLTDTVLTLSTQFSPFNEEIVNDGPVAVYLTGSPNYGLVVNQGASNVIVRGNHFSNLSFEAAFIGGEDNLYELNVFEGCNGFNAVVYSGQNNMIRKNWIRSSPPTVYIVSPDAMENWPGSTSNGIVFEENFIENFEGPLGVHHLSTLGGNSGLTFRNNVFINAGPFVVGFPNIAFINNTFYRVSRDPMKSTGPELHAITFMTSPGRYSSEGAVIKNNIFVGCGDATKDPNLRGWYKLTGVTSYQADYNFVTGDPPAYSPKLGFNEGRVELNGGDPEFVNAGDPLGPDGLPFTADDGLRLAPGSKLLTAGEGGMDLGAYAVPPLFLSLEEPDVIRVSWPVSANGYFLQRRLSLTDSWTTVSELPDILGSHQFIAFDTSQVPRAFFRLAR
jgi:Right handed beta helix region